MVPAYHCLQCGYCTKNKSEFDTHWCHTSSITYHRREATDDFEGIYYIDYEVSEEEEYLSTVSDYIIQLNIKSKRKRKKVFNNRPPFIYNWMARALRNSKREPA